MQYKMYGDLPELSNPAGADPGENRNRETGPDGMTGEDKRFEEQIDRMLGGAVITHTLTNREKQDSFGFWQIYGLTVAMILIVMGAYLGYIWRSLYLYEDSMPYRVLDQYCQPVIRGGLPKLLIYEAAKPAKYESSLERDAYIRSFLGDSALRYYREPAESGTDKDVYLFEAGDTVLAAMTLEKIHEGRFGLWEIVKEEIRMPIYGRLAILAPREAAVEANGVSLFNEDKVSASRLAQEWELPSWEAEDISDLDAYILTNLYKKPEITAVDSYGNPLESLWREEAVFPFVRLAQPQTQEAADQVQSEAALPEQDGIQDGIDKAE